jgi:hypothetical protein
MQAGGVRAGAVAVLLVMAVAGGCSAGSDVPVHLATAAPTTPTPSPTPTPKPPAPKPKPVNPFTGIGGPPAGPVIAVKIDNVSDAKPQVGLTRADVVYVELAEGGLTRLVAIYASQRPRTVAPVRSVRNSDPELLAEYGPIALAFSGGAAGVVANFHRSTLADGSANRHGGAYRRLSTKPAPHNLAVDLYLLAKSMPTAGKARDVGFHWAAVDPRVKRARTVRGFTLQLGGTPIRYLWDGPHHAFVQANSGGPIREVGGRPLATPNVLVQFCPVGVDSSDVDAAGNAARYTHTVGKGRVLLFRDGRVIEGTWQRVHRGDRTTYLDKSGKPLLLHPGGTWVLLAPAGSPLAIA